MVSIRDNSMEEVDLCDDDSIEYKVLMVYAQRTLPASKFQKLQNHTNEESPDPGYRANSNGKDGDGHQAPTSKGDSASNKKGRRKSWKKRLTPTCLRPPKEKGNKENSIIEDPDTRRANTIAKRLQRIIHKQSQRRSHESPEFRGLGRQVSLETDGEDEEKLINEIVQILRSAGDDLEKEIQKDSSLRNRLSNALTYGFYQKVTDLYLSVVSGDKPEMEQQRSKVAFCIDVTTRLTAIDNHPMNNVLGFGARYLQDHFSSWIQSQGGWEKALGITEEEVD
ncbi:apoptosis facilitator Bcl-2-like protein 14 [Discoglossus pictus]